MSQLMRADCTTAASTAVRSIVEVTTSGLTHSWGSGFSPYEKHKNKWYSFVPELMAASLMYLVHQTMPWTELLVNDGGGEDESGDLAPLGEKAGKQFSLEKNYGLFEFDFSARKVQVRVRGHDVHNSDGGDKLTASWSFDMLNGVKPMPNTRKFAANVGEEREGSWTCEPYRGVPSKFSIFFGYLPGKY